jgi:serine/threonine-protein kinase
MLPSGEGQVIGKYRVVREIGRGGVGVVYEAENTWTQRRVALKVLAANVAADQRSRDRFLREARTAGRLVHPNVVAMLDADMERDGSIFIVQELLVGEDLETRLIREGPLSAQATAEVLLPVMDALSAAHAAGIVHRDIKPSNVYLTRDGKQLVPKLIDFGLSKHLGGDVRITTEGMALGTPAYMSPEQFFEPTSVDHRTDIWAMAVVWWECLTCRLPFDGDSPSEIAARVVTGKIARLRSVARSIPAPLADAIEAGLIRERAKRWQSIGEMRDAVADAIGKPTRTGRKSAPPPPRVSYPDLVVTPMREDDETLGGEAIDEEVDLALESEGSLDDDADTRVRGGPVPVRRLAPITEPRMTIPDPIPAALGPAARALDDYGLRALRFGIVPNASGFDDPGVADAVGRFAELPVVVLRFGGHDDLLGALREKRVEAAWMSPVAFVRAQASGLANGSLVVQRGGQSTYVSVLLAHRERVRALDLASLRGRRAAWVDRWSAGGYLMPRRMLRERGLDPNAVLRTQASVGTYAGVLDCLLAGTADVGGVYGWRNARGELWYYGIEQDALRPLAVSDPIPSDVLALHAELPRVIGRALTEGFRRAAAEEDTGRALLATVNADGFLPFEGRRYDWLAKAVKEDEQAADGPRPTERVGAAGAAVDDLDWD